MRHAPEGLMVFAAGFGTRMAPLTDAIPKPLLKVGGATLLDHALGFSAGVEPLKTVVNAHYKADHIVAHLSGSAVEVAVESPNILDTGGGLKAALPRLGSRTVYTLNSDMVWRGPNPLAVLQAAWATSEAAGLVLCVPIGAAHNRQPPGDFILTKDGFVSRGDGLVYTGAQILDTSRLNEIPGSVFSLNAYWDLLMGSDQLKGVIYPGEWCDVGTPAGLERAQVLWDEWQND